MFYRCLIFITRIFGTWVFDLVAQGIAAGYFCFAPRRVRVGVRFYRALFPQRSRLHALWCTWKQFRNFTSVYLDRFRLQEHGDIRHTSEGFEHIERALDAGTGGIVLMSHLGNWEVAAYIMQQKRPGIPLLLFMGKRREGQHRPHPEGRDPGARDPGRRRREERGRRPSTCWKGCDSFKPGASSP